MSRADNRFCESFTRCANQNDQRCALISAADGREWSYGELIELTDKIAAHLRSHVDPGAGPILLALPNSIDAIAIFLGAAKAGIDIAPITPQASLRDLEKWCELVKPVFCIHTLATRPLLDEYGEIEQSARLEISPNGGFDWLPQVADTAASEQDRSETRDARLFLYTSGTTGEPKGLVFDVATLWDSGSAFVGHHDFLDNSCRFLNLLPMSYLGGLFNLGLIPLTLGASVVIADTFSGKSFINFWRDVERFQVSVLWLVPTIVRGLLSLEKLTRNSRSENISQLVRACFLGTAPIELQTKNAFEETYGIVLLENYALSETTFLTSETLGNRHRREENSVGVQLPYAEVVLKPLVLEDGETSEGETDIGEIHAKSPYMFVGYLDQNGEINSPTDGDGFMATGDLGKIGDTGSLIYCGRNKDIIKKGGYFVALREIELLALRLEGVEDAAAFIIDHDFYGEDYVLAVQLSQNVDDEDDFVATVQQDIQQSTAKYKWPSKVVSVAEFPKTQSGKVKKVDLAKQLGFARKALSGSS